MTSSPLAQGGAARALAGLALVFALAHAPFLASSLEDIDSVNFALGVRDFDVATHRPHPPGYPVYIFLGKIAAAVTGFGVDGPESMIEAKALAMLSLIAGLIAIPFLYVVFVAMDHRDRWADRTPFRSLDIPAFAATAVTVSCPLLWYLAVRPMSDLPGLSLALASQASLMLAWWRQAPASDGDRRLTAEQTASSGRMIVIGAFLAALSIGLRTQAFWYTFPLLALVLADRIGRGAAGAMLGGGIMFVVGGLSWGIPLLVASGGLNTYLAALGTQAGEDFAGGEMLYATPNPRALAFALLRTFVYPWDSTSLGAVVLILAAAGLVQLLLRDRRSLAAITAIVAPYLVFHLLFQDTSFVRYALPIVPAVGFLAVRGVMLVSETAVPVIAAVISIAAVAIATPTLKDYASHASPAVRALEAMTVEARERKPGALAMHQTFVRPLEAEEVGISPQLPSPPKLEWLEAIKYWKSGNTEPLWFLADPMRSDLALIDPASRKDSTSFTWAVVAHKAFGGLRPAAARWYRIPLPGWFAEEGWTLTPETGGIATVRGRGPHIAPITAMVRRRSNAARLMIGGRHLGGPNDPAARFTLSIDGVPFQQFDVTSGFFLKFFEVPAGKLTGAGTWATLTVQSTPVAGTAPIPTTVEQFDVQDDQSTMWAYDQGWQEAEFSQQFGVWRWTSDRATLRIAGPPRAVRITMTIESPLRYFEEAPLVKVKAGDREIASATISEAKEWTFDVPADALVASGGAVTIETNKTFVPAERSGAADHRRLGLRVFAIQVSNELTSAETTR